MLDRNYALDSLLGVIVARFDMSKLQAPIITGLVISAVSGVTLLAYNNPAGYEKILPWLCGSIGIVYGLLFAFMLGITIAQLLLNPLLKHDQFDAAEAKLAPYNRIILLSFVVLFCIIFLGVLHGLRGISPATPAGTTPAMTQTNSQSHQP